MDIPEKTELELVSPEKLLLSEAVDMVVVPGQEGDFGVLPGHAPFISSVRSGVMDVYQSGQIEKRIFVAGGFAEVTPTRCTVLAEEAVPLGEIDRSAVQERIQRAELQVADADLPEAEKKAARGSLETAQAMLGALERHGQG